MLRHFFTASDNSLIAVRDTRGGGRREMNWYPALMLVWTFFLFAVPLYDAAGAFPHWLWPTLASYPVFLWLYFRAYYRDRRQIVWSVLGIAALGFALTPFNGGAQNYLVYASSFLAFLGGTRQVLRNVALLLGLYTAEWLALGFPAVYLIDVVVISLAIAVMNLNFLRKWERDAELKLSHDEVRRLAALAERERIGRDLHDLLGHTLSLITLKSELAHKLFERDPAAAKREIAEVERVAREALAQVRRAVTGIRAAGLAAELAAAKLLLESHGVAFQYALADVALPVEVETALAMTLREAATNAQRHAAAHRVIVRLDAADGQLVLRVEDDGRGGAIVPGNGLTGMRERLAAIGAELRIESERGRGTRLRVTLPLPPMPAQTLALNRVPSGVG